VKILWINDLHISEHVGGAQQTNQLVIDYGKAHGIDIDELNYNNNGLKITPQTQKIYDYIITNNVYLFSKIPGFLDWVNQLSNSIRFEHDANSYLSQTNRKKLFQNAKLSIFLSDEHLQYFQDTYGKLFTEIPTTVVHPCIDTSLFYDYQTQRSDYTLYAGLLHPLKSLASLKKRALMGKKVLISAIGNFNLIDDIIKLPNVRFVGTTSYEQMPTLYNQHKQLLYCPGQLEPFCRMVGEALLCNMPIDTDNCKYKIGALELYNRIGYSKFQMVCGHAAQVFWETVNNLEK